MRSLPGFSLDGDGGEGREHEAALVEAERVAGAIVPWFRSSDALLASLAQTIQLAPKSVKATAQLPSHVVQNASTGTGVPRCNRAVDVSVGAGAIPRTRWRRTSR